MVYFRKRLTPGILGEINEMIVRDAKERQAKAAESDHDDRPKGCLQTVLQTVFRTVLRTIIRIAMQTTTPTAVQIETTVIPTPAITAGR